MEFTLRQARTFRELSQLDLVLLTGIGQTKISMLERGYKMPSKEEVHLLARALRFDPEDLIFRPRRVKRVSYEPGFTLTNRHEIKA